MHASIHKAFQHNFEINNLLAMSKNIYIGAIQQPTAQQAVETFSKGVREVWMERKGLFK